MKEIQQQKEQSYKFEEFEQHINLFNVVPSGKGNSIMLLRNIAEMSQCSYFDKKLSKFVTSFAQTP